MVPVSPFVFMTMNVLKLNMYHLTVSEICYVGDFRHRLYYTSSKRI